eukprot:GHVU01185701.1.p1 GENE.GHVU01185701.1~~GHVU01185701.1.p1  ORF type:complete len:130 (-),score=7.97 GHVU01185701.1:125-514(-)
MRQCQSCLSSLSEAVSSLRPAAQPGGQHSGCTHSIDRSLAPSLAHSSLTLALSPPPNHRGTWRRETPTTEESPRTHSLTSPPPPWMMGLERATIWAALAPIRTATIPERVGEREDIRGGGEREFTGLNL